MHCQSYSKVILTYLFFSFCCVYGWAQTVDPLTGRAIINLPLASISANDLSASVTLSHHGGALRLTDGQGNAGMGWNISMGGYITREVRGLPDDLNSPTQKGWLFNNVASIVQGFTPSADHALTNCTNEQIDWFFMNSTLGSTADSEPDIFFFEAPGLSGKFIFGADGLPKTIPYQDIDIVFANGNFTIKNRQGITYVFDVQDLVTRQAIQTNSAATVKFFRRELEYYLPGVSFVSTWNLSSMTSVATGTACNFSYEGSELGVGAKFVSVVRPNATQKADTLYIIRDESAPHHLTQIQLKNFTISVSWANDMVQKIVTTESETQETKGYEFVYASIKSLNSNFSKAAYRTFLLKIKQINSCLAFPPYVFTYQDVDTVSQAAPVNWVDFHGQDHFGYFNGKTSNQNIPTLYFYQNQTDEKRLRLGPLAGQTPTQQLNGTDPLGSTMLTSTSFLLRGALIAIDYPTGGTTSFAYEPNVYVDASTGEEVVGPGIRVKSVTNTGGETAFGQSSYSGGTHSIKRTYTYLDDTGTKSSGKVVYPPVYGFVHLDSIFRSQSDLGQGSQVLYAKVREDAPGLGYRIFRYDIPNMYPDAQSVSSRVARNLTGPCNAYLLQNGRYTYPFAPVKALDFARGYLTKLSEYDSAGLLRSEKRMSYSQPSGGSIITGLRFDAHLDAQGVKVFYFAQYQIPVNQSRLLMTEVSSQVGDQSQADSVKVTSTYLYNAKNMLVQSTRTNKDLSVQTDYVKYASDFPLTSGATTTAAKGIFKLNATNRSSEVIERYQYFTPIGSTPFLQGASLRVFQDTLGQAFVFRQFHFPQGLAFTPATYSGSTFTYDSKYLLDATVEYANALPVNQKGIDLITSSTHYSTGTGMPLASFVNCKADAAIYDGFEMATLRGMVGTGTTINTSSAQTGKKSIQLPASSFLTSASISKGADPVYRISMWVLAANGTIITVQPIGGTAPSVTLTSTGNATTWTYLERTMDLTQATGSFTLKVTANAAITLDDFVALPKSARYSAQTFLPLTGLTSQTDDRGNSTVINYDVMGRKTTVLDRNRNLVELTEYGLQQQGKIYLSAMFKSGTTEYFYNQPATFTPVPSCVAQSTYIWTVYRGTTQEYRVTMTGVQPALVYAFKSFGPYNIELRVTNPAYPDAVYTDPICVSGDNLFATVVGTATNIGHSCDNNQLITMKAQINNLNPNLPGWKLVFNWTVTDINDIPVPQYIAAASTGNRINLNFTGSPTMNYVIKCAIKIEPTVYADAQQCAMIGQSLGVATLTYSYIHDAQCQ